ncbi:YciI family protein [Prochlorococcus sp. MIT 1307]|uniref:YciI family protein n=1 Tax=Prochlorococcus sp. MIT 1307 TaxID=3096219 RepID=UPI002A75D099|nr:YciI family protein [Prochlorococcus sp. MIT 1307]
MDRFVLWGTYCQNALEKRSPFREEHLNRLSILKEKGILITLGPTKCTRYVFGIFEAASLEVVKKVLEEDVYWKEGIWTSLEVYPWTQAF